MKKLLDAFLGFVDFFNSNPALILLVVVLLLVLVVFLSHKAQGTPLSFKILTGGMAKEEFNKKAKSAIKNFFMPWRHFNS